MPRHLVFVAVVLVAALVSGSPATQARTVHAAPSTSELRDVTWRDPASSGKVSFRDRSLHISSDCDSGVYSLVASVRRLSEGGSLGAQSVCGGVAVPPPGSARARYEAAQRALARFYAVVEGPADWSRDGNTLTLSTPQKGTLHLVADPAVPAGMVGPMWRLQWSETGGSTIYPSKSEALTLHVARPQRFEARDGCGMSSGTAQVGAVRTLFVTRSAQCPGRPSAAAALQRRMLDETVDYSTHGSQLVIRDAAGGLIVYDAVG